MKIINFDFERGNKYNIEVNKYNELRVHDEFKNKMYWQKEEKWANLKCNENGDVVDFQNSDGYCYIQEYHENGILKNYKDSDGEIVEYAENGEAIYYFKNGKVVFDKRKVVITKQQIAEKFGIKLERLVIDE